MNWADMEELIEEIRREYHIPPFFEDEGLENFIKEGIYRLGKLNPGTDYNEDLMYRSLLKSYVYYAYHGKVDSWSENYSSAIIEWQMGSEVSR